MAYRDGTGPEGLGPLTGRGLGNCTKEGGYASTAGYYGSGLGRRGGGRGMGRGMGRGFRPGAGRAYSAPVDRQASLEVSAYSERYINFSDIVFNNFSYHF